MGRSAAHSVIPNITIIIITIIIISSTINVNGAAYKA
jgi:hypothetical protein